MENGLPGLRARGGQGRVGCAHLRPVLSMDEGTRQGSSFPDEGMCWGPRTAPSRSPLLAISAAASEHHGAVCPGYSARFSPPAALPPGLQSGGNPLPRLRPCSAAQPSIRERGWAAGEIHGAPRRPLALPLHDVTESGVRLRVPRQPVLKRQGWWEERLLHSRAPQPAGRADSCPKANSPPTVRRVSGVYRRTEGGRYT